MDLIDHLTKDKYIVREAKNLKALGKRLDNVMKCRVTELLPDELIDTVRLQVNEKAKNIRQRLKDVILDEILKLVVDQIDGDKEN